MYLSPTTYCSIIYSIESLFMKKFIVTIIVLLTVFIQPVDALAQGMMGSTSSPQAGTQSAISSDGHTAREEAEGKEIWDKLLLKQLECKNLADNQYQSLGEYFMGQMMGSSHKSMNNMMIQMMGEEGEIQMHIAMGKRLSGCEPNAQIPQSGIGFMPMMWMMRGGENPMMGQGFGMMNGWGGGSFGIFGWLSMLLFWGLLILSVVAIARYLSRSGQGKENRTPADILKERYARGEIDKKEFEEKKKDLV